jgi:hypothetical protein
MEGPVSSVKVSPQAFRQAMRQETERMLDEVMTAVNDAPDGAWINASEMKVRDVMAEYRRRVFEKALQMKTDAAEGAFSPGEPANRQADEQQGSGGAKHPDRQRPRESLASALAEPGRRRRGPGRRAAGRGGSDGEFGSP